jgi:hypothetical protein
MRDDDEEEDRDEEEGEITPSPHSLLPKVLPSLSDLFNQQAGISVGAHRTKHPWTVTGGSFGPSPESGLMLVYSDLHRTCVCIGSNEDSSLTWGPVGSAALDNRRGRCVRDGWVVLIGHSGC